MRVGSLPSFTCEIRKTMENKWKKRAHFGILATQVVGETEPFIFRITMWLQAPFLRHNIVSSPASSPIAATFFTAPSPISTFRPPHSSLRLRFRTRRRRVSVLATAVPNQRPLDLTEENVRHALGEARVELAQIFDGSVGITGLRISFLWLSLGFWILKFDVKLREESDSGVVELAELDGPFVKISLKGRFWHKRSTVVARVGNYLKNRIPVSLSLSLHFCVFFFFFLSF